MIDIPAKGKSTLHKNLLFACLDLDLHLTRIGGGNESEVYSTDDHRFVVKLKNHSYPTPDAALQDAKRLRKAASEFATIIGQEHNIPNNFLIAGNGSNDAYIMVVQPFLREGSPLFHINYASLSIEERKRIADQLQGIIRRCLTSYWKNGLFPDIYGRSAASPAERIRRNSLPQLPARLWSFLVRRTLMRAHNLLDTPEGQIRLVDYDPVNQPDLYKRIYYAARAILFLRDIFFIWIMKHTGWAY